MFLRAVTHDPALVAGGGGGGVAGKKPKRIPVPTVRHNYLLDSPGDAGFSREKLIVSPSMLGGGAIAYMSAREAGGEPGSDFGSQESLEEVSFVEVMHSAHMSGNHPRSTLVCSNSRRINVPLP